jgi:hypothetical protein
MFDASERFTRFEPLVWIERGIRAGAARGAGESDDSAAGGVTMARPFSVISRSVLSPIP